jgi:hypothetical protein
MGVGVAWVVGDGYVGSATSFDVERQHITCVHISSYEQCGVPDAESDASEIDGVQWGADTADSASR